MAKYNQSPSQGKQSVKFRTKSLEGPSFEVVDFADESEVRIFCDDKKHARTQSTSQSSEILSTAELVSAVGQIWNCASRSLECLQHKASVDQLDTVSQKDKESCYVGRNDNLFILDLIDSGYLHVDLKSSSYFPCIVQQSLECMRLTSKIPYIPCHDHFVENLFWRNGQDYSIRHGTCRKQKNLANVGIVYGLEGIYAWMSQVSPWPELPISTFGKSKRINDPSTSEAAVSSCSPVSGNKVELLGNSETASCGSCIDMLKLKEVSSDESAKFIVNKQASVSSLCSDYFLQSSDDRHHAASVSAALSLQADYYISNLPLDCTCEPNKHKIEDDSLLKNKRKCEKLDTQGELQSESCSSVINKPRRFLVKQEHAASGALAGIFVSLCLHPIDTIKTVFQSCRAGQKSVCYIAQSVVSERGLTGLYRGITSNITMSAPISAIYTFTYESVKGFLLPSLSKEYHSVAHCTAGACASIATSFIFTPSEHIKQQMQVNSRNQNCWNTVVRIINKGGLPSLYAGWGAVLCRNIPHSIIKFYTYESLKQMSMSSEQPNKQPNTLQTLLCGGLAGSTAAMFSTPFDVVKTRLQTQMPGSARRYDSIINALREIRQQEGVKGLYRGLIPRLVMYMSQGALFFASYEFCKSLFSLELLPCNSEKLQYEVDADDDPLLSL